jgi:hypothetical protein
LQPIWKRLIPTNIFKLLEFITNFRRISSFICLYWLEIFKNKIIRDKWRHMIQTYFLFENFFLMMESNFNSVYCILQFIRFIWSMLFKPQKLDIVLKRIECHLSSASTIRYRRAEDYYYYYCYYYYYYRLKNS